MMQSTRSKQYVDFLFVARSIVDRSLNFTAHKEGLNAMIENFYLKHKEDTLTEMLQFLYNSVEYEYREKL